MNPIFYTFPQYLSDLTALLLHLNVKEVRWLGTSLGGVLGMMLAAQSHTPLKSLILNDVGMIIPRIALQRLTRYACDKHTFQSFNEARNYF